MEPVFKAVSAGLLLLLAAWSSSAAETRQQTRSFGRFGYGANIQPPGWELDSRGFRPNHAMAEYVLFPHVASEWKVRVLDAKTAEVDLGPVTAGAPTKLRAQLDVPGFSLWFEDGIDLRLTATSAPFLSWPEGSVAQTVPTPEVPWVLVSYRSNQPPILLSFDHPEALVIQGTAGDWHLRTQGSFRGWARVLLPLGTAASSPTTASGLGELCAKVSDLSGMWQCPAPQLLSLDVQQDDTSVTATWTYDKPGALVPAAAVLAPKVGYPVRILSSVARQEGTLEEGPITLCRDAKLTIRFPMRPLPAWRYLATGVLPALTNKPNPSVAGIADLAFSLQAADADPQLTSLAGQALMNFLSSSVQHEEPSTGLKMPYATDGQGYDLTAAYALLTQAVASANGTPDLPNPLLEDVLARVDRYTFQPWDISEDLARRASALASVALAMRAAPADHLMAAMLQAGASAGRGLDLYRREQAALTGPLPQHLEALEDLRRQIFGFGGATSEASAWESLYSPIRSFVNRPISLTSINGKLMLNWISLNPGQGEIGLYVPGPVKIGASQNLAEVSSTYENQALVIRFKPKDVGACALELVLPKDFPAVPVFSKLVYDELTR